MKSTLLALVVITATFPLEFVAPASAQSAADLRRCRAINDSLQRLACFDGLVQPSASTSTAGRYTAMDLVDFKTDRAALKGQSVEVSGSIMLFGEMALLATGIGDLSPIPIAISDLPRDQRRALNACNSACSATIRGRVDTVMMQTGLKAEFLLLR